MVFLDDCGLFRAGRSIPTRHAAIRRKGPLEKVQESKESVEGDKHFMKKYEVYPDKVEREVKVIRKKKKKRPKKKAAATEGLKKKKIKKNRKNGKTLLD